MYNDSINSVKNKGERKLNAKSKTLLLSTTAFMVGALLSPTDAMADPVIDNSWNYDTVLGGNVSKDVSVSKITDITVDGGNGFVGGNADILAGHTVNVDGVNGARTFAYRDNRDNITSTLSGNLNSNIQVVIIDKDGLFFTGPSKIDVQGLIATSADVAVADVMDSGTLVFNNVGDGGAIVINGSITVAEAGLAAFVSPFISNSGLIKAKLGNVVMAAGQTVTLDMYGDGLVEVAVDGELADALIDNQGQIRAAGGYVQITAKAAKGTLDNLINNDGFIAVSSAEVQGGKIILSGGDHGTVNNDGLLLAEGGSVDISGERYEQGDNEPVKFARILLEDAPVPLRKPRTGILGGDVTIETSGNVEIYNGVIDANGGDIDIDNGGVFYSSRANTLKTEDEGTVSLNQNKGSSIPELARFALSPFGPTATIQNAVDAIDNSGDGQNTINVSSGVYFEAVRVDHENLALNGANAGIDGVSSGRGNETFILPRSPAFTVTSDNVTIDGFAIIGDGVGNDIGIKIDSADDVTVSNNVMIGVDYGVLAESADYLNVSGNRIDIALVSAISITGSDHANISGNTIANSAIDGIHAENISDLIISDNDVSDSGRHGVYVSGAYNGFVEFQGNTLTDNGLGEEESFAQARFESGDIDMSDLVRANLFINTSGTAATALQFDDVYRPFGGNNDVESVIFSPSYYGGTGLRIVNEALGSTIFSGYAPAGGYYVRFEDGSILDPNSAAPIVISGMNASFDGIVPNAFLGGILPLPVLNFIENRLYDADDNTVNGRGQIFVGSAPLPGLGNIQDFFRDVILRDGANNGATLTINGLPSIGGGAGGLNNIAPAAGGGSEEVSEFAGINPASGGEEGEAREVTCVADALSSIGSGSVTYKFGGTFEDGLASESRCASTNI